MNYISYFRAEIAKVIFLFTSGVVMFFFLMISTGKSFSEMISSITKYF